MIATTTMSSVDTSVAGGKSYPAYSTLQPYTISFTGALSSDKIDYVKVYEQIPITDVELAPTKSVKSKKMKLAGVVPPNAILSAKAKVNGQRMVKGLDKGTKPFNNCCLLSVAVHDEQGNFDKVISFKQFRNKFQTAGSLNPEHTKQAWAVVQQHLATMTDIGLSPAEIAALTITDLSYEMIDISFDIGFLIDRDMLGAKWQHCRDRGFHIIWAPGVHGNSASVKFPVTNYDGIITKKKKKDVPMCVTFIVFSTGRCIVSGPNPVDTERAYNLFRELMLELRSSIELKLLKD